MLRVLVGALRQCPRTISYLNVISNGIKVAPRPVNQVRCISSIINGNVHNNTSSLLAQPKIQDIAQNIVSRSVTKYSLNKGKRKSVKAVLRRFYRLNWGGWIRTKAGKNKKLWKKSSARKRRLRQHVLCSATQSTLLDKMVGNYWRKPRFYVDDPYAPYHVRDEFAITSRQPRPYFPKE